MLGDRAIFDITPVIDGYEVPAHYVAFAREILKREKI